MGLKNDACCQRSFAGLSGGAQSPLDLGVPVPPSHSWWLNGMQTLLSSTRRCPGCPDIPSRDAQQRPKPALGFSFLSQLALGVGRAGFGKLPASPALPPAPASSDVVCPKHSSVEKANKNQVVDGVTLAQQEHPPFSVGARRPCLHHTAPGLSSLVGSASLPIPSSHPRGSSANLTFPHR